MGPKTQTYSSATLPPAALLMSVVLLQVPATLLATNASDFHAELIRIVLLLLAAALAGTLLLFTAVAVLPRRWRFAATSVLYAAATFAWVRSGFYPGPSFALDGHDFKVPLDTSWDATLVPLAVGIAAAMLASRVRPLLARFAVLLLAGTLISTAWQLRGAGESSANFPADVAHDAAVTMSSTSNILVILLDAFQSDLLADALKLRPDVRAAFDGFTYYPDASSDAPTTYLSLPVIHSGTPITEAHDSLKRFFDRSITVDSFLDRASELGWKSAYVRSVGGCPQHAEACLSAAVLASGSWHTSMEEAITLARIGLYRAAPDVGRREIAKSWSTLAAWGRAFQNQVNTGRAILQRFADDMHVGDAQPRLRFLHSLITHAPFALDEHCKPRQSDASREAAAAQAACALGQVARIIDRMRELGIHDSSLIIVVADHGHRMPSSRMPVVEGTSALSQLIGAMNPLVLVKPPASHGEMKESPAHVRLGDVAAKLCSSQSCDPAAFSEAFAHAREDKLREVVDYEWKHEYWTREDIPGARRYRIDGSLFDPLAWSAIGIAGFPLTGLDFAAGGNGSAHLGFGWSSPQEDYTWSDGGTATLFFGGIANPEEDKVLRVAATLYGAAPDRPRLVRVQLNGTALGTLESRRLDGVLEADTLAIPAGTLLDHADNRIVLEIVDPLNPPGPDERMLGVALRRLDIARPDPRRDSGGEPL